MFEVLFFLCGIVVRVAVHLDDKLAVQEGEVGEVVQAPERVLVAVALPYSRNMRL